MKKFLLLVLFVSYNLVAQTPIWHFNFDVSGTPIDAQGNPGNQLTTLSGNLTDSPNFGMDRFGNAQQSLICFAADNNLKYETTLTNLPQGTSARTISYWVRYKNAQEQHVFKYGANSQYNIFGFYDDGSGNAPFSYITTGNLQASTFTHTNAPNYISLSTADSDAWYHYVVVVDAGAMVSIYRNGVLLGTNGMVATLNTIGNTLKFGVYDMTINTTAGGFFLLDDFKIYDVALTESQIKQKYVEEMAFDATDLVAYYGFENNLDCSNNNMYNLTANVPTENAYEVGVIGQSRKITNNPLFSNAIATAIETGDFTIMYWDKQNVNQADTSNDYPTSVELGGSFYARKRQGIFKTGFASNANTFVNEGSTAIQPLSVWTHHTFIGKMIGNSFNVLYYRNGELRSVTGTNTASTSVHTFLDKLVFGGGISGGNISAAKNIQNANLDEIYVYNRVLDQSEILATMYRTSAPSFTSCPTGNVTLTNQAEVNALSSCAHITGNLTINAGNTSLDLSPLNGITTIDGNLMIRNLSNNQLNVFNNLTTVNNITISFNTFTEISGFNALTTVSGSFQFFQNYNLTTATGFLNLATIPNGALMFVDCTDLYIVNAFNNLTLVKGIWFQNTALLNVNFLSSLTQNTGPLQIVQNNYISNFNFPVACSHSFVSGNIVINNNAALTSFGANGNFVLANGATPSAITVTNNSFLTNLGITNSSSYSTVGNVQIQGNQNLSSLNFLTNLASANNITINTTGITNLSGLNNLNSCNDLTITNNASLTSLSGINTNAFDVNGNLMISSNPNLTVIDGFNSININSFNALLIQTNAQLSICTADWVCDYLATTSPNTTIAGNATGCESVAAVNSACAALSNSDFDLAATSLYPNPTNSMFTVEVPNEVVKQVRIFDVTGKMLLDSNQSTLNVSSFASGIYMINIETESGKIGVSKLIKK